MAPASSWSDPTDRPGTLCRRLHAGRRGHCSENYRNSSSATERASRGLRAPLGAGQDGLLLLTILTGQDGSRGLDRFSHLLRVTRLVSGVAGIPSQGGPRS